MQYKYQQDALRASIQRGIDLENGRHQPFTRQALDEVKMNGRQRHIAKLGGLWAGVEFEYDIEAEIRAIRDESMQHLLEEIDRYFDDNGDGLEQGRNQGGPSIVSNSPES